MNLAGKPGFWTPRDPPTIIVVLRAITIRGSIVGTRSDLQEALDFAASGAVKATVSTDRLQNINDIFERMKAGQIEVRIDFGQ